MRVNPHEPHTFARDEDTPGDAYSGRDVCRYCRRLGRPGDARHPDGTLPPPALSPETAAAYRAHDNAITGEKDDD